MSETRALVRLALVRHRWLLVFMVALVVIGETTALLAIRILSTASGEMVAVYAIFFALLPAAVAAIGLFDFGHDGDMVRPESGCSHWLLRMPVRSWKIALVPVVLKTLWVSGIWLLFLFSARQLGIHWIPWLAPAIALSAVAIWLMVIAWRPVTRGWQRLCELIIALPVLYLSVAGIIAGSLTVSPRWQPALAVLAAFSAFALYGLGLWAAIHAVHLARTAADGIIPKHAGRNAVVSEAGVTRVVTPLRQRHFGSPARALWWHDLVQSRGWIQRTLWIAVLPSIVVAVLFVPTNGQSVLLTLILFGYFAGFSVAGGSERTRLGTMASLPPYIAASPLRTTTIAWTRLVGPLVIAGCVFLSVNLVFAGWALWPENRAAWLRWASAQAVSLGVADQAVAIGVRWSIAIVLAAGTLVLGQIAAFLWVGMTGRGWVGVVVAFITVVMILVPLGVVLTWFLRQTDYETMMASGLGYLAMLPAVVVAALVLKMLAVVSSVVALRHRQVATMSVALRVIAIWGVVTIGIGTALAVLIPDERATIPWCLAATTLAIPLSRILILPLALDWNRHR